MCWRSLCPWYFSGNIIGLRVSLALLWRQGHDSPVSVHIDILVVRLLVVLASGCSSVFCKKVLYYGAAPGFSTEAFACVDFDCKAESFAEDEGWGFAPLLVFLGSLESLRKSFGGLRSVVSLLAVIFVFGASCADAVVVVEGFRESGPAFAFAPGCFVLV